MAYTERQMKALDVILATGIDLTFEDVVYRFRPLTLGDLAECVTFRKSQALAMYFKAMESHSVKPGVRFMDIHNILQRASVKDDFTSSDPANLINMCWLSLRRGGHKDITKEAVIKLLENDDFRNQVAAATYIMDNGPLDQAEMKEAVEGEPDRPDPMS